jgi:sugar phosphate isomerase/epimerase
MQLGIFAKTFPRETLEETLDAISGRGLPHVQFNMSCARLPTLPDRLDEDRCIWIARQFRERGLTMAAISGTFNLCDPDDSRLQENFRRLEILAAACRWLDTRIITLCTGTLDPEDMWRWHPENVRRSSWNRLVGAVRQAVKIADRHEVTLAFEPELNNVVNSVSKARRLLDEIASPWLKVVIDPVNLIRPEDSSRKAEILEEAFDWLGSDIVLAHAKDPRQFLNVEEYVLNFCRNVLTNEGLPGFPPSYNKKLMETIGELGREALSDRLALSSCGSFFVLFLKGLKAVGFEGAIIIHGIEEDRVDQIASRLRIACQAVMSVHE